MWPTHLQAVPARPLGAVQAPPLVVCSVRACQAVRKAVVAARQQFLRAQWGSITQSVAERGLNVGRRAEAFAARPHRADPFLPLLLGTQLLKTVPHLRMLRGRLRMLRGRQGRPAMPDALGTQHFLGRAHACFVNGQPQEALADAPRGQLGARAQRQPPALAARHRLRAHLRQATVTRR